ncbi:uncharacterized protein EI97DRAFT_251428 [Westerdykella ornata]|uniref:Uncharacterized protein n=1 Tax=Westerdykella ornata TaxID=318751 RepID=A0A6A6JQ34_WESOR|nr:uncharacterized protein EI97DRAFT_251428 [Westerdykella ornata]KAF2278364.1 hypothetical protein EI97DRAFT_251428 [Westerdykella ornata]
MLAWGVWAPDNRHFYYTYTCSFAIIEMVTRFLNGPQQVRGTGSNAFVQSLQSLSGDS